MFQVKKDILKKFYKKRPKDAKKYDYGLLLIIGGSEFYSGSPALAGMAGFRSGVDMVRILAPKRAADIIASFSPNLAAYSLPNKYLNKKDLATLLTLTKAGEIVSNGKTAVVIGGGLGRTKEIQEVILEFLSQVSIPCVIDADAIYAIAKKPEIIANKNFLITPHGYEFFVLTKKEVLGKTDKEKIKLVKEEAKRLQTTILLKGPIDIISDGKNIGLNKTGSPLMTKGGMGDTLAGIAGALFCRNNNPFEVGKGAAYINGLAGELASKEFGEGVTAIDLIEAIPRVLKGNYLQNY